MIGSVECVLKQPFTYDALDRMTSRQAVTAVNGVPQVTTVFSQPVFNNTKVHALASATATVEPFPSNDQTITYTGFDKVSKVKQGNDSICFAYGYDHQRILMISAISEKLLLSKNYNHEKVHYYHYIGGAQTIYVQSGGVYNKSLKQPCFLEIVFNNPALSDGILFFYYYFCN